LHIKIGAASAAFMQLFLKHFFWCFIPLARSGGDIKNKHHHKTNSFKYVSNTLIFVCSHPNITANACQTFHPQFNDPHRVANNIKPSRSHQEVRCSNWE